MRRCANKWSVADPTLAMASLPYLVDNYFGWEKEKLDSNGLFWQTDNNDGMEVSIGGKGSTNNAGYRATINSYMYGDAVAITEIARLSGNPEIVENFSAKARTIKENLQTKLWDEQAGFFKVLSRDPGSSLCTARELHGYTPWMYNLPDSKYSKAWKFLMDPKYFYAPYGPTTAEQGHPGFETCRWK